MRFGITMKSTFFLRTRRGTGSLIPTPTIVKLETETPRHIPVDYILFLFNLINNCE